MKLQIIRGLLAFLFETITALGCAVQLHRFSRREKNRVPIVTILIIGSTALITGLQFVYPEVLTAFRRNREALWAGEWWRMVTPLFVQAYGWPQACINGAAAIVFCPLAERLYGKRLLALYFIPGVLAQIFGYLWRPHTAGSSLGIVGVIGGLFAFALLHRQEVSGAAQLFAICGMAGGVALCFGRDIHGPPIVLGVLVASGMTILWPGPARNYTSDAAKGRAAG